MAAAFVKSGGAVSRSATGIKEKEEKGKRRNEGKKNQWAKIQCKKNCYFCECLSVQLNADMVRENGF